MFCSISGEVPQEPVVSKPSGLLFEKRLIEKAIKDQGKCPVTGENLATEDLLVVQANKALRPRPISGTSIPGLLVAFQNEWDEVMLETFTLRQHLDTTRQELAQALYQHDAACRVIARLMQERDEARLQLASMQSQGFSASHAQNANGAVEAAGSAMETVDAEQEGKTKETEGSLQEAVVQELVATCAELSAGRKARKGASSAAVSKEVVKSLAAHASHTPHKADSKTGVTCVAVHSHFHVPAEAQAASTGKRGAAAANASSSSEAGPAEVILSGSTDKNVLLTHLESGKVLAKLSGHAKKINAVSFHSTVSTSSTATSTALFSASADKTVRMWTASDDKYSEAWCYKGHSDEVLALSMHPSGNYMVSVASDGWHFLDVRGGLFLQGANTPVAADAAQYTCGAFHPDGLILGTGSSTGALRIWDVRTMENPHTLAGHSAAMSCLAFSENGYQAASGGVDGSVRLWDLRKLTFTQSLELGGLGVGSVAFDHSGAFLAVGGGGDEGTQLQVRVVKDWSPLVDLSAAHTKAVTGVAWTANSALVSGAMDRTIKVHRPAA